LTRRNIFSPVVSPLFVLLSALFATSEPHRSSPSSGRSPQAVGVLDFSGHLIRRCFYSGDQNPSAGTPFSDPPFFSLFPPLPTQSHVRCYVRSKEEGDFRVLFSFFGFLFSLKVLQAYSQEYGYVFRGILRRFQVPPTSYQQLRFFFPPFVPVRSPR